MPPARGAPVAVLKKTDPSPLAPESDEEKAVNEKPDKPADKPTEETKAGEQAGDKTGAAGKRARSRPRRKSRPGS